MGRRKSKRGPPPKRKNLEALDTMFNCPFCNHERSCEVKIDKTRNTGRIQCTICMEDFQVNLDYEVIKYFKYDFFGSFLISFSIFDRYQGLFHMTVMPRYARIF
jgi:transcription elongation factor Elf1